MKAYFQFSRRQKIGVATLALAIVFLTILLNVNNHRGLPESVELDVSQIDFSASTPKSDFVKESSEHVKEAYSKYELFEFDPNQLSKSGWEDLGFSEKQSNSIVKYRENYGPFRSPNDVSKIYVISEDKFTEIEPYIRIKKLSTDTNEPIAFEIIQLNSASAEELETISGIGPTFAKRTIKYRELLGGFVSKAQFAEIYGITEDAVKALEDNVEIDLSSITRIAINTAPKDEIRRHPYLKDWAVITAIISQRDKSHLKNLDFLLDQELMSNEQINQVLPYINFE